jgi:Protein of unknown function (DUF1003)
MRQLDLRRMKHPGVDLDAAAIRAVIMMSQNRQDMKDRLRSELHCAVNRRAKSEARRLIYHLLGKEKSAADAALFLFLAEGVCPCGQHLRVDGFVQGGVLVYLFVPTVRSLQRLVYVVDVFDALGVEPLFECFGSLGGVDLDAVFPGGAAAEDSVEAGAGFDG